MTDRQLNVLGFPVGGSTHQPLMVRARGHDGKERWIEEVPRGRACRCTCLECGQPVLARQGTERDWSFAHTAASQCSGGVETLAHRFAKDVIADAGGLYVASTKPNGWDRLHPRFVELDDIRIEHKIQKFRADLVGSRNGRELIIEIKVTHGCSHEKIAAMSQANCSVLEIDLSLFRYKSDEDLRRAVVRDAKRYWLALSDGRALPLRPTAGSLDRSAPSYGGLRRPRHVPARAWEIMSPLEKLKAVDPDGRQVIRSRGYGR